MNRTAVANGADVPAVPSPLDPEAIAAREWPTLRSRLIDIAASLDRLDAAGAHGSRAEAERLLQALLQGGEEPRAERLLELLSRPYDPAWRERFAAGEDSID